MSGIFVITAVSILGGFLGGLLGVFIWVILAKFRLNKFMHRKRNIK